MAAEKKKKVLETSEPRSPRAPIVFDSPHSGNVYPEDFYQLKADDVDMNRILRTEDSFVDKLYQASILKENVPFLKALFPRSYIDPNRAPDDFDPDAISGTFRDPLNPSDKSFRGMGLVWTQVHNGQKIYKRDLTAQELAHRIDEYHQPYQNTLKRLLKQTHDHFGVAYHVNLHSMPSTGSKISPDPDGADRADFVISDRLGQTCEPAFTQLIVSELKQMGYSVSVNKPYQGGELLRQAGHPEAGVHSVQVEINRRLYMDEKTLKPTANFENLQKDLQKLVQRVTDYAVEQTPKPKAKRKGPRRRPGMQPTPS